MQVGRLRQLGISIALGSCLALGCGGEKSETPDAGATTESPSAAPSPSATPAAKVVPHALVEDIWLTELPADWPADVPRYPGSDVVKARPSSEAGFVAGFSTGDDPAKVASYFADAFAAQGWSTNRVDAPEGIMIFADKGERSVTCGVGTAEGKTQIDLLVVEMR